MKPTQLITALMWAVVCTPLAWANEIPRPDGIVHGFAYLDGEPVVGLSDATIIARVQGKETPAAYYHMGAIPTAGNCYVLHFPHAVLEDGRTPCSHNARAGQTASVYIKMGDGPEQYVGDVTVPDSAEVRKVNLPVATEDFSLPAPLDLPPVGSGEPTLMPDGACGQGAAPCGAIGLVNICLMFVGLRRMKKRHTGRRQDRS